MDNGRRAPDAVRAVAGLARVALARAEAVTLLSDTRVPDDVYHQARARFSETD
jgi:alkylhydroperoxidase family enzyme